MNMNRIPLPLQGLYFPVEISTYKKKVCERKDSIILQTAMVCLNITNCLRGSKRFYGLLGMNAVF
jgi:hypothetical protein